MIRYDMVLKKERGMAEMKSEMKKKKRKRNTTKCDNG